MKKLKQLKYRSDQVAGRRILKLAGTLDPKNDKKSVFHRLRNLEDIEEIRKLKAAYCSACDDDHNGEAVAALFVEDGTWQKIEEPNVTGDGKQVGRAAISAFMFGVREARFIKRSSHMVSNPVIHVKGDRATGLWKFIMLYSHVDGRFFRVIGRYEDTYIRHDGKWFFQSLTAIVEENNPYMESDRL